MNIPPMMPKMGQTSQEQVVGTVFNHGMDDLSPSVNLYEQTHDDISPCFGQNCQCCMWGCKSVCKAIEVTCNALYVAKECIDEAASYMDIIQKLQTDIVALTDENKKLSAANKKLNAKRNGIKTVTVQDRKSTGKRGRAKGCTPTVCTRPKKIDRTETIDCTRCPHCNNAVSKNVMGRYDRVVVMKYVYTETVKFDIMRRYCRVCDKNVSRKPPGVEPYARTSSNLGAAVVTLNMHGLSHGKAAKFSTDVFKTKISRSWSHRNKMRVARRLTPERDEIKRKIQKEPCLNCDEFYWPVGKKNGMVMGTLGRDKCLMEVVESADIKAVKKMLPDYKGTVIHDSKTIWLHTGKEHQMCMWHQRRIPKTDLKYKNPKNDVKEFLDEIYRLNAKHYPLNKISDMHTRIVAARCLEKERSCIMNHDWTDDEIGTIARYRKRHYREGFHMTTHMYKPYIPPDNNNIERVNRQFVATRSDGGGNRSPKGMEANSVLFTIWATDWINGVSFFDHVMRASSGDG